MYCWLKINNLCIPCLIWP